MKIIDLLVIISENPDDSAYWLTQVHAYLSAIRNGIELSDDQIHNGIMALTQCSSSEVESFSKLMLETYKDEVVRVYNAVTKP